MLLEEPVSAVTSVSMPVISRIYPERKTAVCLSFSFPSGYPIWVDVLNIKGASLAGVIDFGEVLPLVACRDGFFFIAGKYPGAKQYCCYIE